MSRAGVHLDGKNTPGSYSALIVFETDEPFFGSYYMLPQYHMGLDVRQGQCRVYKLLLLPLCDRHIFVTGGTPLMTHVESASLIAVSYSQHNHKCKVHVMRVCGQCSMTLHC